MFRIILFVLVLAALALAISTVLNVLRDALRTTTGTINRATQEDIMPDTFRRIAYVALIILMFGVAAGVLGAG